VLPHWYLSLLGGFTQTKNWKHPVSWGGDEVRATLQTSGYRFQDDAWNAMEVHSQRSRLMLCRVFVEGIWRRFEATEDWVDIIKGKEEAGLAWIAANYLHGTFVSLLQLGICFNFTVQNGGFAS